MPRSRKSPKTPAEFTDWFWSRVSVGAPDVCWLWRGGLTDKGYGRPRINTVKTYAHRIAYVITHGPLIDDMEVCHRCDQPACCNPAHLFIGTHAQNMRDMSLKGRAARGVRGPRAKLTEADVLNIRAHRAAGIGVEAIGRIFAVSGEQVSKICTRRQWAHL